MPTTYSYRKHTMTSAVMMHIVDNVAVIDSILGQRTFGLTPPRPRPDGSFAATDASGASREVVRLFESAIYVK